MKKVEVKAVDNIKPMNQATKERHQFNQLKKEVEAYYNNVEHFIEAVALVLCAGFTLWFVKKVGMSQRDVYIFQFAAALLSVRGGWELLKSFKR